MNPNDKADMTEKSKKAPDARADIAGLPCLYCKDGVYQLELGKGYGYPANFGLAGAQPERWRLALCNVCGHVQFWRAQAY